MQTYNRVSDSLVSIQTEGRETIKQTLRHPKLVIVAILAVIVLLYFVLGSKTPEEQAAQELATAVTAVGKLMILPEGDEPVLATVTDAKALIAQQAFFAGSVDGDQLLLFPKSLKAVIYSPSRDKIINAGPVEQSPSETVASQTNPVSKAAGVSVSGVISVEVRNGTDIAGLGARVADEVRALPGFEVIKVADAKSKTHQKTLLASRVSEERGKDILGLTSVLGAEALLNIAGEEQSLADVLVVVGLDNN